MTVTAAYNHLMACSQSGGTADAQALGRMLLHRCSGAAAPYPHALGLPPEPLAALVATFFPDAAAGWKPGNCFSRSIHRLIGAEVDCHHPLPSPSEATGPEVTRLMREESDFLALLLRHRSAEHPTTSAFAIIIARACVENDHLWHSLGLTGRAPLAELLSRHFHPLASANIRKLRWKRFFYERLHADGRPTDRATICDSCPHQPDCYSDSPRLSPLRNGETAPIGETAADGH